MHEYTHPFCRGKLLPLLSQISTGIIEDKETREIMDLAVETLAQGLENVKRVGLTIFNKESGAVFLESAWGYTEEEITRGIYKLGEGITGWTAQSGLPIIIPQVSKNPNFLNRTGARDPEESKDLAFLCVPIKMGSRVLGTISLERKASGSYSLAQDQEVLSVIAAMIAQTVELHQARDEENTRLRRENLRLQEQLKSAFHPSHIIGNSAPMRQVFGLLEKVYGKTTPVLILGETGTGKEVIASALHYNSPRASGPFVKFNCAALPESLAESELFGHEKGAFTGAVATRKGKFEEADGGTIFLDEVGELTLPIQAKLLRILQQRELERVGSNKTLSVDIRLIAATNRDLPTQIKEGKFREDLYYRLNIFPITLPPLRERGSDLLLLADFFVEKYAKLHNPTVRRISTPAIELLSSYHWPGNVRELENVIERAVILADDGVIHGYHLPPSLQSAESSGTRYTGTLDSMLEKVEKEMMVEAMKVSKGNMAQAARELGLTERVMALRMKKHNLDWHLYRGIQGS